MATRLYFPLRQPTSPGPATLTPGFDGGWNYTTEASRGKLSLLKDDVAIATGTQIGPWTATAGQKALDRQYISAPLRGQTISGTFKGQIMTREFATTDNVDQLWVAVKVISNDGGTVRATLFSHANATTTAEFINNATHQNKKIADGDSLSSYTCTDGDRLLIEIGYSNSTSATTPEAAAKWGGGSADLPEDETQTTDGSGWVEFSATLEWSISGIQLETIESAQGSASSSLTVSHVTGTQTQRLLVVIVSNSNAAPAKTITGITYNSVALTLHATQANAGGDMQTGIWYLVDPPSGTFNIVVTFSATTDEIGMTAYSFYNADPRTPIRSSTFSSGNASSSSVSVTSAVGDLVMGVVYVDQTTAPTAAQTLLTQELNIGGFRTQSSSTVDGAASSTTSNWTHGTVKFVIAGFSVPPGTRSMIPFLPAQMPAILNR